MSLKSGVRVQGIRPELVLGLMIVRDVFARHGVPFVITSVVEGVHKRASLHYTGCGADLRSPPVAIAAIILADAKAVLGDDFDLIIESNHWHCEYQPKQPY